MPFAMDGNKQERKQLVIEHKTLKWIKMNNVFPRGSLWWVLMANGMTMTSHSQLQWL
jgi:hypothetical protein